MGKTLIWYIVPRKLVHDPNKTCFNWEYQTDKDWEIESTNFDTLPAEAWCPKCKALKDGLYQHDGLINHCRIKHRYENPIWDSKWHVRRFYLGKDKTSFLRMFNKCESSYREIDRAEVERGYNLLESRGRPILHIDILAYEETRFILEFLQEHLDTYRCKIVMEDE